MTTRELQMQALTPWPAGITLLLSLGLLLIMEPLLRLLSPLVPAAVPVDLLPTFVLAVAVFAAANLLVVFITHRLAKAGLGQRQVPKVLLDLLRVIVFALAGLIALSLFFRQDLSGILTGSGLVLAVLGFAIRNVVADVFSGIALGVDAPFRIGDWVQIEGLSQGKVLEIGWRTTHLTTRDSTYVILPNSQISRQKITNFSAPRQEYRDFADVTLPADVSIDRARGLIRQALDGVQSVVANRSSEIHVIRYDPEGITYRVKYWLAQHDQEIPCRNEIYIAVDRVLRANGIRLLPRLQTGMADENGTSGEAVA